MIKALLVDDELWVIKGLLKKIKWSNYFIEIIGTATDGIEAYNLAIKLKPDIIITDVRMPGMDGLELIEKINLNLPGCLCIILSGYDDFSYVQKALRIGAFDYVLKPIDNEALEDTLVRVVKKVRDSNPGAEELEKLYEIIEDSVSNSKISSIVDYIAENYNKDINLNIVADLFEINPSYLSTAFKKYTGTTFSDYVADIKIKKAKQLLLYTNYKVGEICNKVGFPDYRQFVRTFKKLENTTPMQFKRGMKEEA